MPPTEKFSLLRSILKTFGLSAEAVDDVIDKILDLLSDKDGDANAHAAREYPYALRKDFLSPAEASFYYVLADVVAGRALISAKVSLADVFYAKITDASQFRIFTNKIDRKHVDFLLCNPHTVAPILGIELDDKSHQRGDRQARDEFVEHVFAAAHLPLLRIPVRAAYSTQEIARLLDAYLTASSPLSLPVQPPPVSPSPERAKEKRVEDEAAPRCPKCGGEMLLRTAKTGANQGGKFWGCKSYPQCRGVLPFSSANP